MPSNIPATPRRILFLAYGGGHMNMLIPVIRRVRAAGRDEAIVFGLTTGRQSLEREGIPAKGYQDLVTADDQDALEAGRSLLAEMGDRAKLDPAESAAYLGLNWQELVARHGEAEASEMYRESGRAAFLPLAIADRILDRFQPDLVLATNSPRSEKALLLRCRDRGIPSLCIVDLFDDREFRDRLAQPGYGSRICVFSESVRDSLIRLGRPEQEIAVTGNPIFDDLADPGLPGRAAAMRAERGWQERRVILWARQVRQEHLAFFSDVERHLYAALERHPDWQVVIRPHPNDPTRFGDLPERVSLSRQEEDLSLILHAADCVITVTSTVGLQGVACGTALVSLQTPEVIEIARYTPYADMGLSIGVNDLSELEDAVTRAVSGYQPVTRIPPPGTATDRVVAVVDELLEN